MDFVYDTSVFFPINLKISFRNNEKNPLIPGDYCIAEIKVYNDNRPPEISCALTYKEGDYLFAEN